MEIKTNDRGFAYYEFEDSYGASCSLQKSSAATKDKIWLGVNDAKPKILATNAKKLGIHTHGIDCGWIPFDIPDEVSLSTRMHLTQEQVAELIPILQKFVETGEI